MRRFLWSSLNKQMNVVGLDCQSQDCPTVFIRHFIAYLIQALRHLADQYLLAPFGYPHEVVTHLIDCMVGTFNLTCTHVDSLKHIDSKYKGNVRFHPGAKAQGFPAPENYKLQIFEFT